MLLLACLALQDHSVGWVDLPTSPSLEAPKRWNGRLPLSDPKNVGRWVRFEPMSDEFHGPKLDPSKWLDHNPDWKGRQPAFFSPANVAVHDGRLELSMTTKEAPEALRSDGYHTFASAAVQSVGTVLYGYFEVRARPMRSHGSSSFWFYKITPENWTEIDVFEIGAGAPGFERKDHITGHFWHSPTQKDHWAVGSAWTAPQDLADGYRVYGFEWSADELKFYVDGALVRKGPNTVWHQPLTLNFDSETMPDWFGLPSPAELPSVYSIDYVRAWRSAWEHR